MSEGLVRLGGLFGVLWVVTMIPAYVVGSPDLPRTSLDAQGYFGEGSGAGFLFGNGVIPLFATLFLLVFVAVLYGLLRNAETAEGGEVGVAGGALAGGVTLAILSATGMAVELAYPATLLRFDGVELDPAFILFSLALATWLYHFCQIGAAVMAICASLVGLATGLFPRWLGFAGFVAALFGILHFTLPLVSSAVGLLWVAVVSVSMITGAIRLHRRNPRAS